MDNLIEEVLEQQPTSIQTFLLQTAILDRMTGSLCDALTGQENGQAILEMLERANLFVVPLDEERRWYRYHHLFADLLRQRLRQLQPGWISTLHFRASERYEQNGFASEAIEHALRREDFARAADMIEDHVDDIWQPGLHTRLRRWLDELPADVVFAKPHLCILHAGDLYTRGQIGEAERRLQVAEQALGAGNQKLRGRAAVIRAHLVSYQGDLERAIYYARQALEYLPADDLAWR